MDAERIATIRALIKWAGSGDTSRPWGSTFYIVGTELCDALVATTENADNVAAEWEAAYLNMRTERDALQAENTRLKERLAHPEYYARLLRAVEAEPEIVIEVLELRDERDRLASQVTDLTQMVSDLLADVSKADEIRAALARLSLTEEPPA